MTRGRSKRPDRQPAYGPSTPRWGTVWAAKRLLHHGPARGKVDASAGEETLTQGLHPAYQLSFVHKAGSVVLDDDAAIHNNRMHAATIGVVHQRVDGIEERSPLGAAGIKQYQVGFFAGFYGAKVVLQPHGARTVQRRKLYGEFGGHDIGSAAGVLVQ